MSRHTDTDVLIDVNDLSRYYPAKQGLEAAVNHISFQVRRGQVLGFLGPNGAGKSTTMQMLTGNLSPSSGEIHIGGYDLMEQPIQAKSLLGYLPDTPPLYKELTVDEYLAFAARLNQIPRTAQPKAILGAKERCGLTEVGRRLIANLSKGYQQRVGIAQAIIHSPEIVILDEPTVGLDPLQMREIRQLIRELGESHSVILSSHVLPEIQSICSDVQIIHRGELVLADSIAGLNQRMQTTILRLGFALKPEIKLLEQLQGIASVETQNKGNASPHYFLVHLLSEHVSANELAVQQLSQQIVALSEQQQWGLFEITPERLSLEDIFMQLTTEEHDTTLEASA